VIASIANTAASARVVTLFFCVLIDRALHLLRINCRGFSDRDDQILLTITRHSAGFTGQCGAATRQRAVTLWTEGVVSRLRIDFVVDVEWLACAESSSG
jgi:hypothetical protein